MSFLKSGAPLPGRRIRSGLTPDPTETEKANAPVTWHASILRKQTMALDFPRAQARALAAVLPGLRKARLALATARRSTAGTAAKGQGPCDLCPIIM